MPIRKHGLRYLGNIARFLGRVSRNLLAVGVLVCVFLMLPAGPAFSGDKRKVVKEVVLDVTRGSGGESGSELALAPNVNEESRVARCCVDYEIQQIGPAIVGFPLFMRIRQSNNSDYDVWVEGIASFVFNEGPKPLLPEVYLHRDGNQSVKIRGLTNRYFLNGPQPVISQGGFRLAAGESATYWLDVTLLLRPSLGDAVSRSVEPKGGWGRFDYQEFLSEMTETCFELGIGLPSSDPRNLVATSNPICLREPSFAEAVILERLGVSDSSVSWFSWAGVFPERTKSLGQSASGGHATELIEIMKLVQLLQNRCRTGYRVLDDAVAANPSGGRIQGFSNLMDQLLYECAALSGDAEGAAFLRARFSTSELRAQAASTGVIEWLQGVQERTGLREDPYIAKKLGVKLLSPDSDLSATSGNP